LWKTKIKSEREIIKRCRCCVYLSNVENLSLSSTRESSWGEVFTIEYFINCKKHGEYEWFFFARELQTCEYYKPNFEGIMREAIKKHEEEGNEVR
jgi:hypothetical protein